MTNAEIDAEIKRLKALKESQTPQPKNYVAFILTMPGIGSWNGKWTGSDKLHVRTMKRISYRKELYPDLKEGYHSYRWDDGWAARVEVRFITAKEAKDFNKRSDGFCGYDHFITEIIKYGEIRNKDQGN